MSAGQMPDEVRGALEAFRYRSSRPDVGMRELPPHVVDALLPFVVTLIDTRVDPAVMMEDKCPNCGLDRWPKDPLEVGR